MSAFALFTYRFLLIKFPLFTCVLNTLTISGEALVINGAFTVGRARNRIITVPTSALTIETKIKPLHLTRNSH